MTRVAVLMLVGVVVAFAGMHARVMSAPQFVDLFNGKNLKGWVNVNTAEDTWRVKNGVLICSGHPIGVMRSEKPYENFVLHVEDIFHLAVVTLRPQMITIRGANQLHCDSQAIA